MAVYLRASEQMLIEDLTPLKKRDTLTQEDAMQRTRLQMKGCSGGKSERR